MASEEFDVAIVGAGVAGLAAAKELVRAKKRVIVIEAKDRVGGRVHTIHDRDWPIPIELGAEFVHGRDPKFWPILQRENLLVYQGSDEHWHLECGRLVKRPELWEKLEKLLAKMPANPKPDLSFAQFIEKNRAKLGPRSSTDFAVAYVEGFNAADAERISVRSLVEEQKEDDAIGAETIYRFAGGYDQIVNWLANGARAGNVKVQLRTAARTIRWKKHRVEIETDALEGGENESVRARQAIVTLPLGVLQAEPDERGAVGFEPEICEKIETARRLAMGPVVKIAMRFRDPFWEERSFPTLARGEKLTDMSMIHGRGILFQTWWTYLPMRTRVLMGWAGGPPAAELSGKPAGAILEEGLASLSKLLGISSNKMEGMLEAWHVADWQSDPFSRGAYSYVPVGASDAVKELAQPIRDTLFFAGEATQYEGLSATVPGAIETGWRAAREVIA